MKVNLVNYLKNYINSLFLFQKNNLFKTKDDVDFINVFMYNKRKRILNLLKKEDVYEE